MKTALFTFKQNTEERGAHIDAAIEINTLDIEQS
jgi:hypothetical protein